MGRKLFVGNLNFDTTGDDLKQHFAQAGTVESAQVMTDRTTGRSRGFGFVEMSSDSEAKKAVEDLNGKDLQGRNLNIDEARERTPGPPRGGGGGGFSRDRGPSDAPFESFGGFRSPGGGGGGHNTKPRKEGGSRRGLRAKKRSL
jgi:cold-inducible RNA-binding protein